VGIFIIDILQIGFEMKKILVTGADGFIGSHLAEALVKTGYSVRALTQYNSFGSRGWLDQVDDQVLDRMECFAGDIRDATFVQNLMKDCQVVFHLAALIAIPYSYVAPYSYFETNVMGTLNVMEAAKQANIERIIHTSTSEVYGSAKFVPITESHPLQAQSPYSASKIGADQVAQSYHLSYELPVVTLRPFNTYGPRQSARAVIPTIIIQALSGVKEISIGSTFPTRDFTFVDDTVSGFIAAMLAPDFCLGKTLNLGSNFEISIGSLASLIIEKIDPNITIKEDLSRLRPKNSEVDRLWADNSKALEYLNWKPAHQGLQGFSDGIEKTIAWFAIEKNLERYRAGVYNI
jgi:dTDP-glucose 4,6-dehydratase